MRNFENLTLIFLDTKVNFKKNVKNKLPGTVFHDAFPVETYLELKGYLEHSRDSNKEILFFVHVFAGEDLKGFNSGYIVDIQENLKNLDIHWVTSSNSGAVGDKIGDPANTYTYRMIHEELLKSSSRLKPQSINSILNDETILTIPYIFLSHSSKDENIVTIFVEKIFKLGLNISLNNYFLSNQYLSGIELGSSIPEKLKEALVKSNFFISFLSTNYKKSEICMNEMGAGWFYLKKEEVVIIRMPGLKGNKVGFLNIHKASVDVENKNTLLLLVQKISNHFQIKVDFAEINRQIDNFIQELNKYQIHRNE